MEEKGDNGRKKGKKEKERKKGKNEIYENQSPQNGLVSGCFYKILSFEEKKLL